MSKFSSFVSVVVIGSAALFGTPSDSAITIDFDDLAVAGPSFSNLGTSITIGDYRFDAVAGGTASPVLAAFQTGSSVFARTGSGSITGANSADVAVSRVDGSAFSLVSFDFDNVYQPSNPPSVQVEGSNGAVETFAVDLAPGNQLFSPTGFGSVTSVLFTTSSAGIFFGNFGTLDNLTVTSVAAVPLPAAGLMLASAIGGMGWASRRRRRLL